MLFRDVVENKYFAETAFAGRLAFNGASVTTKKVYYLNETSRVIQNVTHS